MFFFFILTTYMVKCLFTYSLGVSQCPGISMIVLNIAS